ncbi:MAG: rod shape-determining protein RodA, partial [Bacteroidales bacterium]|nr:rod shape-determining protein RodA [Bacteroidales bacterium]
MEKNRRGNTLMNIDWITVTIYLLLVFIGWVNIYSAVYDDTHSSIFDFSKRYGKQLIWIGAAFIIIIAVLVTDSKFYSAFAYPLYAIGVLLLISVLFFGVEVNNSKSWFEIGTFRMQPVEFTKITICLALAQFLSSESFSFNKISKIGLLLIILGLPVLLIFVQNDTGSALVFFAFIFVLYREGLNKVLFITAFVIIALFIFALVTNLEILLIIILCVGVLGFILTNGRNLYSQIVFYCFLLFTILSIIIYNYSDIFSNKPLNLVALNTLAMGVLMFVLYLIKKNNNLLLFFFVIIGVSVFVLSVDYLFNNALQTH